MDIIAATPQDFETVRHITQTTIREIYPAYYPAGAVEFFCRHHSDESIRADIESRKVYLLCDDGTAVGTITIRRDEICRLFVLPQYQHRGYGSKLLDFAERLIIWRYGAVRLDASLPAREMYRKRGYIETEFHKIRTENGDYLCYDVMVLNM